ncbi:RNA-directed DNA polymerase, eukaryota, reverse transcriptase zinc-binding domain protein, partial [Tanacetum coccineum]
MKQFTLSDHELVQINNSLEIALVKVKSVETMSTLYRLCCEKGFNEVKIHHIGGLWLWLQFQNEETCNAFKKNNNLKSFFSLIKPVSKNFFMDERMVWVKISGLPLCAWGSNAYKKVASTVGKFMFFENDNSASMSLGRVCVATKQKSIISEGVQVTIHGEDYTAQGDEGHKERDFESIDDIEEDEQVAKQDNKKEEKEQEKQQAESIHSNTGNEEKTPPIETDINKGSVTSDWSRPPGKWINSDEVFFMINIYGPQESIDKLDMWNRLLEFIHNHDGHFVIFGDLNKVRDESKRYGTEFCRPAANVFNAFIDDARLFEPVLGGHVKVKALPRGWSDHTPIMLHYEKVDYGPVPFKLFHSWLQRDGFDDCVKMAYNECSTNYPLMPFHEKLKVIKQHFKNWTRQVKNVEIDRKQEIISKISDIEAKIDSNTVSEVKKEDRMKLLKERDDLQQLEDMDVTLNMAFHTFYKDKFDVSDSLTELPPVVPFATLSQEDSMELEKLVTLEEIRAASYWELLKEDMGNDVRCVLESFVMPRGVNSSFITLIPKISNPIHIKDIRPISLIGMQYKIIAKILANRLSKVIDKVVSKEQSAFIAGRQIIDGPIVLSELMIRGSEKEMKKVDPWVWGRKWRRWIQVCLHSARSSVLVNGSPTSEFSIKRGLRQGDLLSPFLFIIVMEGLHITMKNAVLEDMASHTGCVPGGGGSGENKRKGDGSSIRFLDRLPTRLNLSLRGMRFLPSNVQYVTVGWSLLDTFSLIVMWLLIFGV